MAANSFNIVGSQQIVFAADTAQGLTLPTGLKPRRCIIGVSVNGVRWAGTATLPTQSLGLLTPAGSFINFNDPLGDYLSIMQQIRLCNAVAGANATLDIIYLS